MADTEGVAVLVMRDIEGNLYFLDDKAIQACRATPEQQDALTKAFESQDVAGFAGIPGLPNGLNIVVNPQINTAVGLNVVAGAGLANITQGLGQGQLNSSLFAIQK